MIFADELTPPAGLLGFIACAAFLMLLADRAISLWRNVQPRPPMDEQLRSLRNEIFSTFCTKGEVESAIRIIDEKIDEREQNASAFRKELRADIHQLDEKLSSRSGNIFDALRSLSREVSHLEGRLAKTGKLPGGSS